ncbi:DUF4360 domain-containing protein [Actinomadura sp. KC216]|uniref:DUF4360 domain-containing protein n=1 Tax=Actinomadura sp. KC216 TaxID=2530370 RepID=UPI001405348B|nr:DUF4360 domain-containing protein [Actinomadura sp. KC216]
MRKRNAVSVVATAVLAATAASGTPTAAAGPRTVRGPVEFSVKVVSVNGSGCPVHTVWADAWPEKESFRVVYSEYLAQAGGSSRPIDSRKQCQVAVQVNFPQDVTYAVSSSDHQGFAHLESGASATVKVGHYIQGQPWDGAVTHNLNGAYDDIWRFTHRLPADQLVFRPCGEDRNTVLITELRVDKGTSDPSKTSYIAMDAVGEGVWTTYHLTWKSCP